MILIGRVDSERDALVLVAEQNIRIYVLFVSIRLEGKRPMRWILQWQERGICQLEGAEDL
jgi:hypothetical protein